MKKLILFLFMALFAISFNTTYGQLDPRAVTCLTPDALHPIPGTEYEYTIDVPAPTPNWTSIQYNWFVTQDPDYFIQNGVLTTDIEPGTGSPLFEWTGGSAYNIAFPGLNTSPTINLTWKSFAYDPDEPVFVAILVTGENGVPCAMNNFKVYKIEPEHAFTLDIDNLTETGENHTPGDSITGLGYGDNMDVCMSNVMDAVYDPVNNEIDYYYGKDSLYFEVVAANWYDRYQIGVEISGLIADSAQTAQIDWAYAPLTRPINYTTLAWNVVAAASSSNNTYLSSTLVEPQNGTNAVGSAGESIVIRVIVDHGTQFDGIYDNPINIAVNGVLAHDDGSGSWVPGDPLVEGDIHYDEGGTPPDCPWFDGYVNDISLQTIKARPTINAVTPAPFLPQGN